jgi:hypothetical protein
MTESSANTAEIKITVDASKLTWSEFVLFSGGGDEQIESSQMVRLVNKMIVNQDEIKDLPFLDVFEALQAALTTEFNQISNPKN